ncbi:hypothetical protein VKT23_010833 [Stygiomarasmius scandens]|uniref:CxC2-like cysteine cluster KDZ transposase-associated domain-containing protein n=1 Tax=Marasmiellus scandens TaxID=2682957 RepID=A0ABR1JB83_9AGAR
MSRSKRRKIDEDEEFVLGQDSQPIIPFVSIQHEEFDNGHTVHTTSRHAGLTMPFPPMTSAPPEETRVLNTFADLEAWKEKMKGLDLVDDEEFERELPHSLVDSHDGAQNLTGRKARVPRGDPVLRKWAEDRNVDSFLSEMLRLDGRAYSFSQTHCTDCKEPLQLSSESKEGCYRCLGCEDSRLYCKSCVVRNHRDLPFHKLQEWRNHFFQPTTLYSLGAIFQVGHPTGAACLCEASSPLQDLVVLDVTGVHTIRVRYCTCQTQQARWKQLFRSRLFPATQDIPSTVATFRLLQHFHILSFMSKVSAREYYFTLERLSDNTSTVAVPDRYRELLRMVRQWRLLKTLKRHGRGHDPEGYTATQPGECALLCPACPMPGINLPEGWNELLPCKRWIYRFFMAMDANFRLVRLKVSSEDADLGLIHGFQYFVESNTFQEHLLKHSSSVNKDDADGKPCHNHKAVSHANMRREAGLHTTGVAASSCSRHAMKLPCSQVDLQVGERFFNMDFAFLSALMFTAFTLLLLGGDILLSYDIMCTYIKNLFARLSSYPPRLKPPLTKDHFVGVIPKFHLPGHVLDCGLNYNFNYTRYSGRTHGESIEQSWSDSNSLAGSTKVMGPGSRRDVLDDHFGFQNWKKRTSLPHQYVSWISNVSDKREEAVQIFKSYDEGVQSSDRQDWLRAVEEWEKDQSKPNPYQSTLRPPTFNSVRLQLAQEEANALKSAKRAVDIDKDLSLSAIIVEGLELRELQRRLLYDLKELTVNSTDLTRSKVLERANTLRRRIDWWCSSQALFFPTTVPLRACQSKSSAVCDVPLLLPSDLVAQAPQTPLDLKAAAIQWDLELAIAADMLERIRLSLIQRKYLWNWKDRYSHGQKNSTRSATTIKNLQSKIDASAARYRVARASLLALGPGLGKVAWENTFKELKPADVRGLNESHFDDDEQEDTSMSWIWQVQGINADRKKETQDALRIAWCKARARAHRYQEECILLQEEMRRIRETYQYEARLWAVRGAVTETRDAHGNIVRFADESPEAVEGRKAYASYQMFVRFSMAAVCSKSWSKLPHNFLGGLGAIRLDDDVYTFV